MSLLKFIENQETYFKSGDTLPISKRKRLLKNLKKHILINEKKIYKALNDDLRKSNFETFVTEIGILITEIDIVLNKIDKWAKKKRVKSSLLNFPSSDYVLISTFPYG